MNELVEFLRDNMATKNDIKELQENMATKSDIKDVQDEIEDMRTEMTAGFRMIQEELNGIKARLTKLEKRTIEDADAAAKDILELRRRLDMLESKVRQLQSVRS